MTLVTRKGATLIRNGRRLSVLPFRRRAAETPAPAAETPAPTPVPPRRRRPGAGVRPLPLFALCLVIAVVTLVLTRTFGAPTYSAGGHGGSSVSAEDQGTGDDPGTGASEDPGTGSGGGQGDGPATGQSTGADSTTDSQVAGQSTGQDQAPRPVPQPQAPAAPPPAARTPDPAPSTPARNVPSTAPSATTGPTPSPAPAPVVSFEAEAATNTLSSTAKVVTCAKCSGGRKVGHLGRDTGTLTFNDVHVTGAGKLDLVITYLNGDKTARTGKLSVNGADPVELTFAPTGDWNTTGTVRLTVTLKDGANVFAIGGTGPAPDLDKISLG